MNSISLCLSGGHYVAAGFDMFILHLFITYHCSGGICRHCNLVLICHSRGHQINVTLLCVCGGRYVAAEKCNLVVYMFTPTRITLHA